MSTSSSSSSISFLLSGALLLCFFLHSSEGQLVPGLSWDFYASSCPSFESIARSEIRKVFSGDVGITAGLLRLHFHDCFVQGCDGSVLLDGTGEREAIPNLTLRKSALEAVENIRRRVHSRCGRIVSCSDILTAATRDSVHLSGGPYYRLPYGRRDSLTAATEEVTLRDLPPPFFNTTQLLENFGRKNLSATDLVALSGGHTVGISVCRAFTDRLYPTQDPTMDPAFASQLRVTCPTRNTTNTTVLDILTPNLFDNGYFVNLVNRRGLFTSDQDLFTDIRTKWIVLRFALYESMFFKEFKNSMVKMSQLEVLTGNQGEIRANCSAINSDNIDLVSAVAGDGKAAAWSAF